MLTLGLERTTTLPPAQQSAASRTSVSPSGVVASSVCVKITAMPQAASSNAATWNGCTRSPVRYAARPIVKKACSWMTSEARPGVMCPRMARNKSPNCPAPMRTP